MKYNYNLVYSKRRSISASVSVDNVITVRCPIGYPKEKVDEFLAKKRDWFDKIIEKNSQSMSVNADIISLKKAYVQGNVLPVIISNKTTGICSDGIYLSSRSIYPYIYCERFDARFINRVMYLAEQTSLKPQSIKIRDYRSRWGSCNARGNITFNYKIHMLAQDLQDYIIIHELCHLQQMNHSAKFWRLVETYMPDYKQLKKRLKNFDFLTRLY